MLKYIAVTLVALVTIGLTFGDESRRQEVSRSATDPVLGLSFANFAASEPVDVEVIDAPQPMISEALAIERAIEAGKAHRATQAPRITLRGTAPVVTPAAATEAEAVIEVASAPAASEMWYVTGTRVNIRSGPGTGNAVVTQAALGDEAEPLTNTGDEWIEVRFADGTTGWIFSKFLSANAPG